MSRQLPAPCEDGVICACGDKAGQNHLFKLSMPSSCSADMPVAYSLLGGGGRGGASAATMREGGGTLFAAAGHDVDRLVHTQDGSLHTFAQRHVARGHELGKRSVRVKCVCLPWCSSVPLERCGKSLGRPYCRDLRAARWACQVESISTPALPPSCRPHSSRRRSPRRTAAQTCECGSFAAA